MAATGKTPILLYGSTTATNTPSAGNLTNSSDGCEIAINVADKNLFFKDSTNVVNTVPIRQSSASSNGWLSSTDWSTFNNKQPAGTYVTSVTGTAPVVSSGGTTPAISMAAANGSTNGYLTSTDWNTFNGKAPAFTYTSNYIPYGQGTTTPTQSANLTFNGSTLNVKSEVQITGSNFSSQSFYGSSVNTSGVYTGLDSGGGYVVNVRDAGYFAVSTNNTERWRTFSSGGVSIGNTTDPGATNLSVNGQVLVGTATALGNGITVSKASGTSATFYSKNTNNTSGDVNTIIALGANANNTSSFYFVCSQPGTRDSLYIYGNGNVVNVNNSYGTLSDIKLKENVVDATSKLEEVLKLKVRNFNLKSDPELKQIGFVAQEMQEVFPGLVDETPDKDTDGNLTGDVTLGIKTSVLLPILIKAFQEQNEIINSLTSRIAILEGK